MDEIDFDAAFAALTGNAPFPWQRALYRRFATGDYPDSCNLPTGLGKTSVIAVWLIALTNYPERTPRRLVYVVNRRSVVDQTTDEVERYAAPLAYHRPPIHPVLLDVSDRLRNRSSDSEATPLAISTLRGQFADNREWSADPSRPAVICGTVDMIGSRLLFSGYGVGFKGRPLHAGFLGQDVLLIHDEAHLEPAFQDLLIAIRKEQERCKEFRPFRVMELSATSRGGGTVFTLSDDDRGVAEVAKRINAKKTIHLHANQDPRRLAEEIAALAVKRAQAEGTPAPAVLVFVQAVKDVKLVVKKLPSKGVEQLTGTLRGKERDELVRKPVFQRFLPPRNRAKDVSPAEGTVYLVCTSAGEVGVNISADHLVCDLSTYDSMAQRCGRVNRFGDGNARIDIIHPAEFEEDDERRHQTLRLLRLLNGDASPAALGTLLDRAIREAEGAEPPTTDRTEALRKYILSAYAPPPVVLPTSDMLFDAWALTTVRDVLPGRPPVVEYLHGVEDDKTPETHVGWREEVSLLGRARLTAKQLDDLFDEYPPKPHELLRDRTYRVFEELEAIAERRPDLLAWVMESDGSGRGMELDSLVERDRQKKPVVNLAGRTVLLPPEAGGLSNGLLVGEEAFNEARRADYDVAGQPSTEQAVPLVRLVVTETEEGLAYRPAATTRGLTDEVTPLDAASMGPATFRRFPLGPMRVALRLDLGDPDADEDDGGSLYVVLKREQPRKESDRPPEWPSLSSHLTGVKAFATEICKNLRLPDELTRPVVLAATCHDRGKGRGVWQRGAGNTPGKAPVSKPIHGRPPENLNGFRHELGSLIDVQSDPAILPEFQTLPPEAQELALHLIATHHGRGRPHFPDRESFDPDRSAAAAAGAVADTPGRFARLQRKYGRWGLAYLESLLRAADALDSKRIEETPLAAAEVGEWPKPQPGWGWPVRRATPEPTVRVNVDPTNPGQFFACCGLLELADRLWPGAEGWFADGEFCIACEGDLPALLDATRQAELTPTDPGDIYSTTARLGPPFDLALDWWQDEQTGGKPLKPWAGTMESVGIARAMRAVLDRPDARTGQLLDYSCVVPNADDPKKKKEPYHFDSRRGANALPLDIGFVQDPLGIQTLAHPAVEFFCLVGLQRCRPVPTGTPRVFDYFTWESPCATAVLPAAVCGLLGDPKARGFRFENAFRTGQKKHKAFNPAVPVPTGDRS